MIHVLPPAIGNRPATRTAAILLVLPLLLTTIRTESSRAEDSEAANDAAVRFFERNVRPLLADHCFECHGPDGAEGELRVDSRAALLHGGTRGPAIVPGKPEESLLLRAVRHGEALKMPPKSKLAASDIGALARWVSEGATWPNEGASPAADDGKRDVSGTEEASPPRDQHWSLQPLQRPRLPDVRKRDWIQTPVDAFVLARLEQAGLHPARRADKRTLIRRATFDLTGLPPTPEQVRAFLADEQAGAFARVVDRLLASPQYGERWGRHWLDVARYADSNGLDENLAYANAFRYRDYVVKSFNRDKRLDRFVQEQIAGDLLPAADTPQQLEQLTATGFLCIGPKMLAEDDPVKLRMDIVDEQVDTVGRAFLGMTLGCARCHDHKFDPITQRDYYALAGVFHSTQTMDTFSVVARWHERPLADQAQLARRADRQRKVAELQQRAEDCRAEATATLLEEARRHVGDYLLAAETSLRRAARLAELQPLGPRAQAGELPGCLLREAEAFDRGNVRRDTTQYGQGIGVLVNRGETPNFVEYDIQVPRAGVYRFEVRYAAAASRPCRLLLDGRLLDANTAAGITGSWLPDTQRWEVGGLYALPAGPHVLRLEQPQFFPHIDKLLLVAEPETDAGQPLVVPPLDPQYRPLSPLVQQWVDLLRADTTGDSAESWLARWKELVASDSSPSRLRKLAAWCQQLSGEQPGEDSEQLGDHSEQPGEDGTQPPSLDDAAVFSARQQADFRRLLASQEGPFRASDSLQADFPQATRAVLRKLEADRRQLEDSLTELPMAMAVEDAEAAPLRLHYRGSHLTLGPVVARKLPEVLSAEEAPPIQDGSGRRELARWLTSAAHPLTARVLVNRVWLWHFGQGLVRTPDNFGRLGADPTHPELLDWLSGRLVHDGWRLKDLHRLILLSATWQMSTTLDPRAHEIDPDNRLWWRANRKRLEAEALRDALLAVSEILDRRMGGSLLPTPNRKYVTSTANINPVVYDSPRRSIYLPVVRSALYEVFQAFDFADPSVLNGRRQTTTVAPQALFMMNSRFVAEQTEQLAKRLLEEHGLSDAERVARLYELAYAREPRPDETRRALGYVRSYQRRASEEGLGEVNSSEENAGEENAGEDASASRLEAWQSLCRAVLASNEFVYVE